MFCPLLRCIRKMAQFICFSHGDWLDLSDQSHFRYGTATIILWQHCMEVREDYRCNLHILEALDDFQSYEREMSDSCHTLPTEKEAYTSCIKLKLFPWITLIATVIIVVTIINNIQIIIIIISRAIVITIFYYYYYYGCYHYL